jgi:CBS domain-containing protein
MARLTRNLMNIGHVRTTHVVVTNPERALAEAARLMRQEHVGSVVVVDPRDPERRPIGMLTDRDIVRGQLSKGADLHCLTVGDVMSHDPLCLKVDMSLGEGISALNARGVRRAPVVDGKGTLIGIVTLDDLLPAIAAELRLLAQLMGTQSHRLEAR